MHILLLNQTWFSDELREAGHEVTTCGLGRGFDVPLDVPLVHIDNVIKSIPGEKVPDRIVFLDNSAPLAVSGLEEKNIPTLFYSVDTHHHFDLHKYLHHVFDYTLVAQKDYISQFEDIGLDVHWMPLWASRYVEASDDKKFDAVFVGTLSKKLNPERVVFFENLGKKVPLLCKTGDYWDIFPFSEIVVNQTVKSDLNFRVFEAMMCGPLLLTEESGNGLSELFESGKHLVTYKKNDVEDAASKINHLLQDRTAARAIAKAGREEILAKHLPIHRAKLILNILENLTKRNSPIKHFAAMANFNVLRRKLWNLDTALSKRANVIGMKCAEFAFKEGETLTEELALHFVSLAVLYDNDLHSTAGADLLLRMAEKFSHIPIVGLAAVRVLLNRGSRVDAEKMAARVASIETETVFSHAEQVVAALLTGEKASDDDAA